MELVEAAELAAGASFVPFDSHVDNFDSRDDGLRASAHMPMLPHSQVFLMHFHC